MIDRISAAKDYISMGMNPIPLPPMSKNPNRTGWQKERYCLEDVEKAFAGNGNIGVITGNGIVDIDFDCPEAVALAKNFLPDTAAFGRKSNPSSHRIYKVNKDLPYKKFADSRSNILEFRSTGGQQTVFPPSLHADTGELIEWETTTLGEVDADALFKCCSKLAAAVTIRRHWKDGIRDDLRTCLTGILLRKRWTVTDTDNFVNFIAHSAGDQTKYKAEYQLARLDEDKSVFGKPKLRELTGDDCQKILEWLDIDERPVFEICSSNGGLLSSDESPIFTDTKTADFFARTCRNQVRYWPKANKWLLYDGKRWTTDKPGGPYPFVKQMLESLYSHVIDNYSGRLRAEALKSLSTLEYHKRQENVLSAARGIPELIVNSSLLDDDPMLLNVRNGTLDLKTGQLRSHSPEDLITKLIDIDYTQESECPTFLEFLNKIFDGNQKIINYLQRYMGYCLTGSTKEQVLLFFYGLGSNGKSTLVTVLQKLLGELATTAGSDLLMYRYNRSATNDLAALRGTRLVAVSEFEEGERLAEATIKTLTGGDRISCRYLYGEYFDYQPEFKIILSGNHKPTVKGRDLGIWRRIHMLHFGVTIRAEERDPQLTEKLNAELSGILAWSVQGCLAWQKESLNPPSEVLKEVEEYRQSEDVFQQWLDGCCDLDVGVITPLHTLLQSYQTYSNLRSISSKKMSQLLSEAGFERGKSSISCFRGLRLAEESY